MLRYRRAILFGALAVIVVGGVMALVFFGADLQQQRTRAISGQAQACGALTYAAGRLSTATSAAQRAEACFAQADAHCQAATLTASVMGVDTGVSYTLIVQPPLGPLGGCQIVLTTARWGIPPISNRTETTTCGEVALAPDSLTVSACGGQGDLTLPSTQGAPW